jgi:hypothetical protein
VPPLLRPPANSRHLARPPRPAFSAREWRLIQRLRTPLAVQKYLDALPYNTEPAPDPPTLRTFRGVVRTGTAHCLEAALSAAVILEQHGFLPVVMSLESIDGLDHVIFIYQSRGRWGSVARSRDPGLHGRKPVFKSLRDLAKSYFEPYIDTTGCLRAYGAVDLRVLGGYNWRLSNGNVWQVAQLLYDIPHRPIRSSEARVNRLRAKYFRFRRENPGWKPTYYDQSKWSVVIGQWPMTY